VPKRVQVTQVIVHSSQAYFYLQLRQLLKKRFCGQTTESERIFFDYLYIFRSQRRRELGFSTYVTLLLVSKVLDSHLGFPLILPIFEKLLQQRDTHFQSHNVVGKRNRLDFDVSGKFGIRKNHVLHHMEQQRDPLLLAMKR